MSCLKRWLYLAHRWAGIALCLLLVLWFVSGMVMMYVGYPHLSHSERLQHLPGLGDGRGLLAPQQALERAGVPAARVQALRLHAGAGARPVYLAELQALPALPLANARALPASSLVIDARSGERQAAVTQALALASAAAYAQAVEGTSAHAPLYLGAVQEDAFSHSRALDAHRPLHRVQLFDRAHTLLYISGQTGEVVRDAPRRERYWGYAGAWLHWLYMFRGNAVNPYWGALVNSLSVAGLLLALSGTWVGVLRWRFKQPYRSGRRTPYPGAMMRWHHMLGLGFAAITLTWLFSGWMSMNPWRMFSSTGPGPRTAALHASPAPDAQWASPEQLLALAPQATRELQWLRRNGQNLVLAHSPHQAPRLLDARSAQPTAIDPQALARQLPGLMDAPLREVQTLQAYDLYYYDRAEHTMTGGQRRPLPIWRAVFDDAQATWVHIDPHTGSVLGHSDQRRRLGRWLFAMLHSWDWLPLLERRPLWDGLLLALSLGGLGLSASGAVVGWRRLRRRAPSAAQARAAQA